MFENNLSWVCAIRNKYLKHTWRCIFVIFSWSISSSLFYNEILPKAKNNIVLRHQVNWFETINVFKKIKNLSIDADIFAFIWICWLIHVIFYASINAIDAINAILPIYIVLYGLLMVLYVYKNILIFWCPYSKILLRLFLLFVYIYRHESFANFCN